MDAHQIKAHLMNFRFLFIVPFVQHGLFEIFLLQKVTPKIQSWTPRPRWSYRCLASRKIAPFQSQISFKWLSARSWHWFCTAQLQLLSPWDWYQSQVYLLWESLSLCPAGFDPRTFRSLGEFSTATAAWVPGIQVLVPCIYLSDSSEGT